MTVSVDVPEPPVILVGLTVAVRPALGLVVRVTVPVNPLTGDTVIAAVPDAPALIVMDVVLAVMVKSWTVNVMGPVEWDSPPLVPVTVTWKVPVLVKVQDNVLEPEPMMVDGLKLHAALLADRLTLPAKPFRPVTVIVEVPAELTFIVTDVGLADIVKSWTMNVTVTEWDITPLVPVTNTCIVETAANVHERMELPEPVTLVGVSVHDVLLLERLTVPVNPLSPVMVMVDVPAAPTLTGTVVGLAVMVKSAAALNVTVTECDREPLVPVTVT